MKLSLARASRTSLVMTYLYEYLYLDALDD
jgi:hypothetical protein